MKETAGKFSDTAFMLFFLPTTPQSVIMGEKNQPMPLIEWVVIQTSCKDHRFKNSPCSNLSIRGFFDHQGEGVSHPPRGYPCPLGCAKASCLSLPPPPEGVGGTTFWGLTLG